MFSIVKISECPPRPSSINHSPSSQELQIKEHQVKDYRVSCSSRQHIHPVKRDKSRASLTAKERSDLWQRFQNIDPTEYQHQGKAMQLLTSSSSYVRFPRVDDDIPLFCSASANSQAR